MTTIEAELAAAGEGASGQTELARSKLEKDFKVCFPISIEEQHRIVTILDEAFEGIAATTADAERNLASAHAVAQKSLDLRRHGRARLRRGRAPLRVANFNRTIEIEAREAYRVKIFMEEIAPRQKTLVFCATQDHAAKIRDAINQVKANTDPHYCERVTADDGAVGEHWLRQFQDNEKTVPTILTTSQKLSTGVDARNVRNIVLLRPVNSMIEFKQIIGRGTRLFDGKEYFTIHDFEGAYQHFLDPEWDGEPMEPVPASPPAPRPEPGPQEPPGASGDDAEERPEKLVIRLADGKARAIRHISATSFWGPDGRPMSAAEFIESLFGRAPELFKDEDELRRLWGAPDTRKALMHGLAERGFGAGTLKEMARVIDAPDSDVFDVLAYVAFALPPISRADRVAGRKSAVLSHYDGELARFLDFVLGQYVKQGVEELDGDKLPRLLELRYADVNQAAARLGGVRAVRNAFTGCQSSLFARL